ncbi:MAG: anthranilate synthase component I [Actinomycetia bacterium]|nr:anthranilate synthase component I [Actinomycetes bacterium]
MYSLSKSDFLGLAKDYNLIPLYREIVADVDTPVSAFLKLSGHSSFLLESVEGGETLGRYSFIGIDPFLTIEGKNGQVNVTGEISKSFSDVADPLKLVEDLLKTYRQAPVPDLPPFSGGAVGYVGYDAVSYFENIPRTGEDDLGIPDLLFVFTDVLVVFDHLKHSLKILINTRVQDNPEKAWESACRRIDSVVEKLKKPISPKPIIAEADVSLTDINTNFTKEQYLKVVEKAKEYIFAGDILQVVPSQRFSLPTSSDPFDIYRVLRIINPSPYLGYLKLGDLTLVASSPEPLVTVYGDKVTTRPIAGTRPRGENAEQDRLLEEELLSDEKERAEHIMLVDLGRNDLGRVCKMGTVKVDDLMFVERYSHVMHIVSQVSGALAEDKTPFDVLRAAFPAGTVSGAPKIRAMEIIDELEPSLRGAYAGIFGYFSFIGNLDTGITIRTIVIKDGVAHVQAGGGIVADSDPEFEYQETVNKAMAMLRAIKIAEVAHDIDD